MELTEEADFQQPMLRPYAEHASTGELESILSDASLPLLQRLRLATTTEWRLLVRLSIPAIVFCLIGYLVSMSTQIFSGHLGNLELAAVSLGNNGIQVFAYGIMWRHYVGKHTAQGKYEILGIYLQRSIIILSLVGILLTVIYIFSEPMLTFLGQSPEIASPAALFVYGLIPQIFAYAVYFPIQKFLRAQGIMGPMAYISIAVLCINLLLTRLVVYKIGLGLLGASLVLSQTWWINVLALLLYIIRTGKCKYTWTGFSAQALSGLWDFFKLSAASAVMLCLEVWYFEILVLLAGLLQDPELALDSLSMCLTIMGWFFMISAGFNAAASVRESNELGAGHPRCAAFSVLMVTLLSLSISVLLATVVLGLRDVISYVFTGGQVVAAAVSDLSPFLAISLVLNGIQPVLSGVAVGCGWQAFVAYVNVGCYNVVGIPLGAFLGFYFNLGCMTGIWSGMIGGTAMQSFILTWVTFRTDWNEEVEHAMERLCKWQDKKEPLLEN